MSMFFTVPLIACILMNCYYYFAGLRALRYSPAAVIMSSVRRATGYMAVLMVVWVPNVVITMMFQYGRSVSDSVHTAAIFLIAAQGLLDSTVYGLNTKELQKFISGVCCCTSAAALEDSNDVPYPQQGNSAQDVSSLSTPFTRMASFIPGYSDYDPRLTQAGPGPTLPEPIIRQSSQQPQQDRDMMVAGSLGKLVRFGKKKDMAQVRIFQNVSPVQSPMHEMLMEEGHERDDEEGEEEDEGEDETVHNRSSRFARMGTPRRPNHMNRAKQQPSGFSR